MATALKLYETVDALETVRAWIDEHAEEIVAAGGELSPELAQLLDQAEGEFTVKVERVALYIRELLASAKAIAEERDRLAARAKQAERAAEGLKGYLLAQLDRAGAPKVQGQLATVRVQKSPPTVRCEDPAAYWQGLFDGGGDPEAFVAREVTIGYRVKRDAVLAAWKETGQAPDGFTVEQGFHVRIS